MANRLMTLDLFDTVDIVDDDVAAVVDAYMADPSAGSVAFSDGYRIDPALAVAAHPFANTLIGQPWQARSCGELPSVPPSCSRSRSGCDPRHASRWWHSR